MDNEKISFLEGCKIVFITLVAILTPSVLIGYIISLIADTSLIKSSLLGAIIVIALMFLFGFHKPATLNENDDKEEEEDDD